jgi:polyisoprenoid-binding protein YceI
MSATATAVSVWSIDPAHATLQFKVRHLMISWVRGGFTSLKGGLTLDEEDPTNSSVEIEIDAASVNTREEQRDAHLRSADFLDVGIHPAIRYRSTRISRKGTDAVGVHGELTIHGTTREIDFDVAWPLPALKDPWGNSRLAVSTALTISRKDFGLTWNAALEAGGYLVGDEIQIEIDVEFVKAGTR